MLLLDVYIYIFLTKIINCRNYLRKRMRLNIILGIDIDTNGWIKKIKAKNKDSLIIVVDFEYNGKPYIQNGVKFFSSKDGMNFAKKFEKVIYYKSLYAYPMID